MTLDGSRVMTPAMRVALLVLALAAPRPADACSITKDPYAAVFTPMSGKSGHRPLISLWQVTEPVQVTEVAASCAKDTICKGTPIAVEHVGRYMRPKVALRDGARFQITHDGKLLADTTVRVGKTALPAGNGIALVSAKHEPAGLCSLPGVVVRLKVKPTKAALDDAYLLVYRTRPLAAKPLEGLAGLFVLGQGNGEIVMGNFMGGLQIFDFVPKQVFVRLADGEGNLGPVITLQP